MPGLHVLLSRFATLLVPFSIAITFYLYLYPLAHQCAFPKPPAHVQKQAQRWLDEDCTRGLSDNLTRYYSRKDGAPFRLLALGDPQLEGDTSLPSEVEKRFRGFETLKQQVMHQEWKAGVESIKFGAQDVLAGLRTKFKAMRKQADLLGNDFYLAHIYRTLHQWTDPTHVTVLGDLLGSQWIGDEEFGIRTDRFWKRVFKGGEVVPYGVMRDYKEEEGESALEPAIEVLGEDTSWKTRIINVVGNHDIGYAGDIIHRRIERFERAFGGVNGDIRFRLPEMSCVANTSNGETEQPTIRIIVLNSMNIDGPVREDDLQQETYKFINSVIHRSDEVGTHTTSTILLTHIPLHKEAGVCVDNPFFSYFEDIYGGGVKEQNMISKDYSASAILQALFGKSTDLEHTEAGGIGRDGIILTGHDHEGCDVYHYVDTENREWTAKLSTSEDAIRAKNNATIPGLREVTVRSMMGEFGGYAALVSAWWDHEAGKWEIEVERCSLGVQHVWWAVHIIDLVTVVVLFALPLTRRGEASGDAQRKRKVDELRVKPVVDGRHKRNSPQRKAKIKKSSPQKSKGSAFSKRFEQGVEDGRSEASRKESGQAKKAKK